MHKTQVLCLVLIGGALIPAFAASVNTEPPGGFSGNGLSPTFLSFSPGSNQILGSNGSTSGIRDYLTFTIPAGFGIYSITMLDTTPVGNIGFIGIEAGNQLTLPTNTTTAAGLLGWHHYVPADRTTDILPLMNTTSMGSSGFSTPLPAGSYTLWIQDSSPGTFNYGFNVQVDPAPEPATWATCLAVLAGVLVFRRRSA